MNDPETSSSSLHLKNALVVDGTGGPAYHGDVVVRDGRIISVGTVDDPGEAAVVDLSDLVLAPGFIDSHTHYDAQVLWDPDLTPSSTYGITSVVTGNCGYSLAPTAPQGRELVILTLEAVEGMSRQGLEAGIDWSFETFPQYLETLRYIGTRLNVGALVGHSTLRAYVMGLESIERVARPEEVARMCELLYRSMEGGALGFSTSRSEVDNGAYGKPVGSRVADYSEMLALARVLGKHGRGVIQALPCSLRDGPDAVARVVADLAQASGRPVLFSSVLAGLYGPPGAALEALDTFGNIDGSYPGVACMPLVQQVSLRDPFILPLYSSAFVEALELAPDARQALYADPAWQSRARHSVTPLGRRLAEVVVAETSIPRDGVEGRALGDLAASGGVTPVDVMVSLALEEHLETRFRVPLHNSDEKELADLLRDPRCLLGLSDAGAHQSQICDAVFSVHLLQHWVRELEALPIEFAVWRLTGHQAQALQLRDRGIIAPGMAADLVAFDPTTVGHGPLRRVRDLPASADRLIADSFGIEHVWVNGSPIRRHHVDIPDARPGRLLTSSATDI